MNPQVKEGSKVPLFIKNLPREEQEKESFKILEEMKKKNAELKKKFENATKDRMQAEENNASITNKNRNDSKQQYPPKNKSAAAEQSHHIREWDREKFDRDKEKGRKISFNQTSRKSSPKREKYERRKSSQELKKDDFFCSASYNFKQDREHCDSRRSYDSYFRPEKSHEKYKSYYNESKKYRSTSSSCDIKNKSDKKKNSEYPSLWNCDKVNEDKHKRTLKWVKSTHLANLKTINYASEKNVSKIKCDINDTDKCLENKIQDFESQQNTTTAGNRKEKYCRSSYTKFDRYNRSDHSSVEESDLDESNHGKNTKPCNLTSSPYHDSVSKICSTEGIGDFYDKGKEFSFIEKDRKKGFKSKRDSESYSNFSDNFRSCQKKKFHSENSYDSSKVNKKHNIVHPPNQDEDIDGWGHIEQPSDYDDGLWSTVDQDEEKGKFGESITFTGADNEKGANIIKVESSTTSDGGWSTVEEGEIVSEDSEE